MSEHSFVEKPFLDQLDALDWTVIDQGPGIPTDPTKSLRPSLPLAAIECKEANAFAWTPMFEAFQ